MEEYIEKKYVVLDVETCCLKFKQNIEISVNTKFYKKIIYNIEIIIRKIKLCIN